MNGNSGENAGIVEYKRAAGEYAAGLVRSGFAVGLGTGSTAVHAIREIGRKLRTGELTGVRGVPSSEQARRDAIEAGIPLLSSAIDVEIDLTIDGADEIDPDLNLIKGGGGALLREKIVAQASRRVVIVADDSKLHERLGHVKLPVEVLRFGVNSHRRFLESLGARVELRVGSDGEEFVTESGNVILDCVFQQGIESPSNLARALEARAGIAEHGLFLDLADAGW